MKGLVTKIKMKDWFRKLKIKRLVTKIKMKELVKKDKDKVICYEKYRWRDWLQKK